MKAAPDEADLLKEGRLDFNPAPDSVHVAGPPPVSEESENPESEEPAFSGFTPFVPFPVAHLPTGMAAFVEANAASIGCDVTLAALPALSALASAIGNSREIELKPGWTEPSILWTAIIGESGDGKTPAIEADLEPLRRNEGEAFERYRQARETFDRDRLEYERDITDWKRAKGGGDPPSAPKEPVAERRIIEDVTTEAVAKRLVENPRGLLLSRDELAGWRAAFDRYAGKGGGDQAAWLEMHGGRALRRDRAGSPTLYVKRAAVSLTGGIQPGVFARVFNADSFDSGLVARLLVALPPRRVLKWTDAGLDLAARSAWGRTFDRLLSLAPLAADPDGFDPVSLRLSPDAKAELVDFIDAHANDGANVEGREAAAWSKLRGGAGRLALVHYLTRWAEGEDLSPEGPIDALSMRAGIALARWFWAESRRVYAILGESAADRDRRKLLEFLRRYHKPLTANTLRQHRGGTVDEAEAALVDLVSSGLGRWEESPPNRTGPRTRYFALTPKGIGWAPAR
jgi:hypothetical protein